MSEKLFKTSDLNLSKFLVREGMALSHYEWVKDHGNDIKVFHFTNFYNCKHLAVEWQMLGDQLLNDK